MKGAFAQANNQESAVRAPPPDQMPISKRKFVDTLTPSCAAGPAGPEESGAWLGFLNTMIKLREGSVEAQQIQSVQPDKERIKKLQQKVVEDILTWKKGRTRLAEMANEHAEQGSLTQVLQNLQQ